MVYSVIRKIEFSGKLTESEIVILSQVTKRQRDKCHVFFHLYLLALKPQICVLRVEHPQKSGNY